MNLPIDPYSLDKYFLKSTDDRGHGDKVSARVPPDLMRIIDEIISTKKFPYKTSADFIRDSVWRLAGLLYPQVDSYSADSMLARLLMVQNTLDVQESNIKLIKVIDELGMKLLYLDSFTERQKLIKSIWNNLKEVREEYWRTRALRTLKERYGEYLKDEEIPS